MKICNHVLLINIPLDTLMLTYDVNLLLRAHPEDNVIFLALRDVSICAYTYMSRFCKSSHKDKNMLAISYLLSLDKWTFTDHIHP
jgi:hypothetical protein